jgi:hypothetical protein
MGEAFEQAMRQRNYFVLSELAMNVRPRRIFALGLACGFITAKNGAFVTTPLSGSLSGPLSGVLGEAVRLGEKLDIAMAALAERADVMEAIEERVHALPLDGLMNHLNAYLKRGVAEQDDVGRELAGYVRERLDVAREQHRFTAGVVGIEGIDAADGIGAPYLNSVNKEEDTWAK